MVRRANGCPGNGGCHMAKRRGFALVQRFDMCQSMIESLKTRAKCQMRQGITESVELLELIAEVERLRVLNEAMEDEIRTMEWYREEVA